jgi:hypothetical protein
LIFCWIGQKCLITITKEEARTDAGAGKEWLGRAAKE